MDLEEYLASGPPFERPIFDAFLAAIEPALLTRTEAVKRPAPDRQLRLL